MMKLKDFINAVHPVEPKKKASKKKKGDKE